jgi:crotonobetainyl-CoA:carnitine CoA-transferase CaiB-like acyl-CoA transferase
LSETPAQIAHLGRSLGADTDTVYRDLLGLDAARLSALRAAGII